MKTLAELQKQIHETAVEKGWWEEKRSFLDLMALIHSEVSEAVEAWRDGEGAEDTQFQDGVKPEGWAVELADVVIRVLDVCEVNGVCLQPIIERKMAYNQTRPYRHGGKRA